MTRSLTRPIVGSEEAASKVPRRVPAAMLLAGLDLCKKTGVKLQKGSRVVVMADRGGIGKALAQRLERLGVEVLVLEAETDGEQLTSRLATWQKEGDIQGVYWLPALDATGEISDLTAEEWQQAVTRSVKLLFWTAKELYDSLAHSGSFFISATRLGGRHGYDEAGAWAPLGGGVAGLTKALKRERPTAVIKVVDFEPSRATAAPADRLIEETLRDPGSFEVGYCGAARSGVGLVDAPLGSSVERAELDSATVFVVTGAAGSIVSAIVADLAASSKGVFHLLDLAPEPNPADEDLQQFRSDPEALRMELFERMKAEGKRATPAKVERELSVLERARAALTALESVEAAGGQARYHCVDLLDGEAVDRVIAEVRERHGRIDVLIHAAGLEISHALSDKSGEEFDLVFDVKSQGWFHLLKSASDMPVGATVAFSSIAGRFGNAGQTDYSAANDLLCKLTSNLRTSRPETRGVAIDWTAWSGIGMASRGSIPKMMELAGIGMLAPEAGVPIVRRELEAGTRGEVVVAEDLGVLLEDSEPRVDWMPKRSVSSAWADDLRIRSSPDSARAGRRRQQRSTRAALSRRPSNRWHRCPARRHGHRGLCRGVASAGSQPAGHRGRGGGIFVALQILPRRGSQPGDRGLPGSRVRGGSRLLPPGRTEEIGEAVRGEGDRSFCRARSSGRTGSTDIPCRGTGPRRRVRAC